MDNATDAAEVIVCPPSSPPPSPPPDFGSWSQQVPGWFWVVFTFTAMLASTGTIAIAYTMRMIFATRRELEVLGRERGRGTASALSQLEAQVGRLTSGL